MVEYGSNWHIGKEDSVIFLALGLGIILLLLVIAVIGLFGLNRELKSELDTARFVNNLLEMELNEYLEQFWVIRPKFTPLEDLDFILFSPDRGSTIWYLPYRVFKFAVRWNESVELHKFFQSRSSMIDELEWIEIYGMQSSIHEMNGELSHWVVETHFDFQLSVYGAEMMGVREIVEMGLQVAKNQEEK